MRSYSLLFSALLWTIFVCAQTRLDSLRQAYTNLPHQTALRQKVQALDAWIQQLIYQDHVLAIQYMDTLALWQEELGNTKRALEYRYKDKGYAYMLHGNTYKALEHFSEYSQYFEGKTEGDGYYLIDVGNIYFQYGNLSIAKRYYQEAEDIFSKLQHYKGLGTIYGNYALIAHYRKEVDSSFFYGFKALDLQIHQVKDPFQIAHTYYSLGSYHRSFTKNQDSVRFYQNKALELFLSEAEKPNPRPELAQFGGFIIAAYNRLAESYLTTGDSSLALNSINQAFFWLKSPKLNIDQCTEIHDLSRIFARLGQYQIIESHFLDCLKQLEKQGKTTKLSEVYEVLLEVSKWENKDKQALFWAEKFIEVLQILPKEYGQQMLINEQILQAERDRTIKQQEQIIQTEQRLRWGISFIVLLLVLLFSIAIVFLVKLRQKNKIISSYSQKLEQTHQKKERLLLILGHDLRSLFGLLLGGSQNVLQQIQKQKSANPTIQRQSEQINQAAKRAYLMMDGLMQWGSLDKENQISHYPIDCDLEDIIKQTIESLQPICLNSEVQIQTRILKPSKHYTDPNLLGIILRNLFSNAIRYSPRQSKIEVQTLVRDHRLILEVRDQGQGIETEVMKTLFQGHDGIKIATKGGGLGLEIVRDLSQVLGFKISARNREDGNGAAFSLDLGPASQPLIQNQASYQKIGQTQPSKTLSFAQSELAQLSSLRQELENIEVFEALRIRRSLKQYLPTQHSSQLSQWLSELHNALQINDQTHYAKALAKLPPFTNNLHESTT